MKNNSFLNIFNSFLSKYTSIKDKIAITTHNKADVDAISSAYALSRFFNAPLCTDEDMSEGAKKLCEKLNIQTTSLNRLDKGHYKGIVITDTTSYTLCPNAKQWQVLCIIDHHRLGGKDISGEFEIIDEDSPSAAEIVTNLLLKSPETKKTIDKDVAFALCVGIIADGARFKTARAQTFETLAKLMKISKANYVELLEYAEPEQKSEAKLAIIKGFQKLSYQYVDKYLIVTTEVSSNESDTAHLLSEAADIAFVAKWKEEENETRVSSRGRKSIKIMLNNVMNAVAKELGGAGGGHAKAAGAAIKSHPEAALKKCIEVLSLQLAKESKESNKASEVE